MVQITYKLKKAFPVKQLLSKPYKEEKRQTYDKIQTTLANFSYALSYLLYCELSSPNKFK